MCKECIININNFRVSCLMFWLNKNTGADAAGGHTGCAKNPTERILSIPAVKCTPTLRVVSSTWHRFSSVSVSSAATAAKGDTTICVHRGTTQQELETATAPARIPCTIMLTALAVCNCSPRLQTRHAIIVTPPALPPTIVAAIAYTSTVE